MLAISWILKNAGMIESEKFIGSSSKKNFIRVKFVGRF
jgi:hypothetical protein